MQKLICCCSNEEELQKLRIPTRPCRFFEAFFFWQRSGAVLQQQKQHTTYLAREVASANTFFLAVTQEHGGHGSVPLDTPPSLSPSTLPPTKLGPGPLTSLTSTCARSSLCLDKTNTQERYNRSSVPSMHAKTLQTWLDNSRAHIFFESLFFGTAEDLCYNINTINIQHTLQETSRPLSSFFVYFTRVHGGYGSVS